MPVRSLNSSVLKWPDNEEVFQAFKSWSLKVREDPLISGIGIFGSFSGGNWGPGSDLDIILILKESPSPFMERGTKFDTFEIPVPVDLLVYTEEEWKKMEKERPTGIPSQVKWHFKRF